MCLSTHTLSIASSYSLSHINHTSLLPLHPVTFTIHASASSVFLYSIAVRSPVSTSLCVRMLACARTESLIIDSPRFFCKPRIYFQKHSLLRVIHTHTSNGLELLKGGKRIDHADQIALDNVTTNLSKHGTGFRGLDRTHGVGGVLLFGV